MNPDSRVKAANLLGAWVTYDHPVVPDARQPTEAAAVDGNAYQCPVCKLPIPGPRPMSCEDAQRITGKANVTSMRVITMGCPRCRQLFRWP